jgi:uncharacterized protein involved in exopolysaccharide biosynthesis
MKSPEIKMLGLALLIAGLVLCGIGITWLLRPPEFQATARIQIEAQTMFNQNGQPDASFDPYFIQTTFEVMESEVVLSNAISTLDLNNKWGAKYNRGAPLKLSETINILKGNMILNPVPKTKLIAITAQSDDPKEAADIANAVADAYRDYQTRTHKQLALTGLETVEKDFQAKEKVIQTLQTNVDELRKVRDEVQSKGAADEAKNQTYKDAKIKLEQLQEQQRLFKANIDAFRVDISLPKAVMVQFVDPAVPPKSPAGPNRFLGGILLALGLISIMGGWLLLKPAHEMAE